MIIALSWKHTRVRLHLRSHPRLRLCLGLKTHWVRHDFPVMYKKTAILHFSHKKHWDLSNANADPNADANANVNAL